MANDSKKKAAAGTPSIHWNDDGMQTSYANICNVASTREELSIFFGTNRSWQAGTEVVEVGLEHRILMSPFAAKRLHLLLAKVLGEYESRFGEVPIEGDTARNGVAAPTD